MGKNNQFESYIGFVPPAEWLEGEKNIEIADLSGVNKYSNDCFSPKDEVNTTKTNKDKRNIKKSEDLIYKKSYKNSRRNFSKDYDNNENLLNYYQNKDFSEYTERTEAGQDSVNIMTQEQLQQELSFKPIEKLGQNFLVNIETARRFIDSTIPSADVVEIGVGPANLTMGIAKKAARVTGLEIYPGYKEIQQKNLANFNNVEIIIGDALRFDFKKWVEEYPDMDHQIMGNIPFHISEPLLIKCAQLGNKINRITLLVGENLRETITASQNPYNENYSKLAFVTSIYDVEEMIKLDKNDFWPAPPVNGGMVVLSPKDCDFREKSVSLNIRRKIIQNPELAIVKIVKNESRRLASSKKLSADANNRYDRRQTKMHINNMLRDGSFAPNKKGEIDDNKLIKQLNISTETLNTPFNRLNNQQVRELAIALNKL